MNLANKKSYYLTKIAEVLDDAVSDMMREDYEEYVEWKKNGNLK